MSALLLVLLAPFVGAFALALVRPLGPAGWLNVAVSGSTFAGARSWEKTSSRLRSTG